MSAQTATSKNSVSNQQKKSSQSIETKQPKKSSQLDDSDTLLANVAETYKHAVGIVVVGGIPGRVGGIPAGTAWAVGPNKFATNGHVVEGVRKMLVDLRKKWILICSGLYRDKPEKRSNL